MAKNQQHHKINYIEFTTPDIEGAKKFYSTVLAGASKIGVRTTSIARLRSPD